MRCWNCQKAEMEKVSVRTQTFWKCPECQATYIEVPKRGASAVTIERSKMTGRFPAYKPRSQRSRRSKA